MKRAIAIKAAAASLVVSGVFAASSAMAGPWIDDVGRSTSVDYYDATPIVLTAANHDMQEGVLAFDALCLQTDFDRTKVQVAADRSDWTFEYNAELMPMDTPVDVGGWNAPDAALRMSESIFFNKKAQCNLTFMPGVNSDRDAIQVAVSQHLGSEPANADKQFDKKGKAKRHYMPEWSITDADGRSLTIYARPAPEYPGAVHLAVLKKN
ncbi:MAG: hypothetical protein WA948_06055 [Pontixanthobacter sp.]